MDLLLCISTSRCHSVRKTSLTILQHPPGNMRIFAIWIDCNKYCWWKRLFDCGTEINILRFSYILKLPSVKRAFLRAKREMRGLQMHLPPWFWLAAEMSNNLAWPMRTWGSLRIPFQCQSWREFVLAYFVVLQGPVVQKPINVNPRLKNYQGVYFSTPKCCSTLIFGKTLHYKKAILKNINKQKKFSPNC